jgi:hypothetical protein
LEQSIDIASLKQINNLGQIDITFGLGQTSNNGAITSREINVISDFQE